MPRPDGRRPLGPSPEGISGDGPGALRRDGRAVWAFALWFRL